VHPEEYQKVGGSYKKGYLRGGSCQEKKTARDSVYANPQCKREIAWTATAKKRFCRGALRTVDTSFSVRETVRDFEGKMPGGGRLEERGTEGSRVARVV